MTHKTFTAFVYAFLVFLIPGYIRRVRPFTARFRRVENSSATEDYWTGIFFFGFFGGHSIQMAVCVDRVYSACSPWQDGGGENYSFVNGRNRISILKHGQTLVVEKHSATSISVGYHLYSVLGYRKLDRTRPTAKRSAMRVHRSLFFHTVTAHVCIGRRRVKWYIYR